MRSDQYFRNEDVTIFFSNHTNRHITSYYPIQVTSRWSLYHLLRMWTFPFCRRHQRWRYSPERPTSNFKFTLNTVFTVHGRHYCPSIVGGVGLTANTHNSLCLRKCGMEIYMFMLKSEGWLYVAHVWHFRTVGPSIVLRVVKKLI